MNVMVVDNLWPNHGLVDFCRSTESADIPSNVSPSRIKRPVRRTTWVTPAVICRHRQ